MFLRFLISALIWTMPLTALAKPTPATISVGGVTRSYIIDIPPGTEPKPVIFLLHGLGGTGQGMMMGTHLPILGEHEGFVSVFPDAIGHRWNFFPPGAVPSAYIPLWQQAGSAGPPDDEGFLSALIRDLIARHVADPTRIYIAGFSAGGFMSMRMICQHAEIFAGVALISSSMPDPVGAQCHPRLPMPFYALKGTADDHVPYNGGLVFDHSVTVWSADQLTQFFRALDGCSGAGSPIIVPGENPQRESFLRWLCAHGPVVLGTVQGGQHVLYPMPPPGPTLWRFFAPLHR
ncbi:MAG: alpha/beta fold hydrolase [Vitreimonas sp.]